MIAVPILAALASPARLLQSNPTSEKLLVTATSAANWDGRPDPLLAVAISVTSSLLKNQGEEKIYGAIDQLVSNFIPPAKPSPFLGD